MSVDTAGFLRDPDTLALAFRQGLEALLERDGLGPFILVMANAIQDPALAERLRPALQRRFDALRVELGELFALGRHGEFIEEDLLVFLKMALVGFDALQPTQWRRAGDWGLQFNHLRSFRPMRITREVPREIVTPYSAGAFNFNKPFLQKECFWSGELCGRQLDLFYNKYPFASLHGLWVPERQAGRPQFINREDHDYIREVAGELGEHLPGLMFGYNSYGAYASVNHLHFQGFVEPGGMPVMDPGWHHHGGDTPYPVTCHYLTDPGESWDCLASLHADEQPYNALFGRDGVHVFPRRTQGTVEVPAWSSGFTWSEMAGNFIVSGRADYDSLTAGDLTALLARHALDDQGR